MNEDKIDKFREVFELSIRKASAPRSRPLVYNKMSLAHILNEFYPKLRRQDIGNILLKDHATVTYYLKKHDENINYIDYEEIYNNNRDKYLENFNPMTRKQKISYKTYIEYPHTQIKL